MMRTPTKRQGAQRRWVGRSFDAVAESRRWKEAVAARTSGMSMNERMAWFRQQSSVPAIRGRTQPATGDLILREEPPAYGRKASE
jgi:hypothetical protein